MATYDPVSGFYKPSVAETLEPLAATTASGQFTPATPLAAGRWLLQVIPSADTVIVWVELGSSADGAITATADAGPRKIPLCSKTIVAFEFWVSGTFNDEPPAVICETGTATCYLTRVSA